MLCSRCEDDVHDDEIDEQYRHLCVSCAIDQREEDAEFDGYYDREQPQF